MAKQLTLEEMLECAQRSGMPGADTWTENFEQWSTLLARDLARHMGVVAGDATFSLSLMCAPFSPKQPGQPCPLILQDYDPTEWEDTL